MNTIELEIQTLRNELRANGRIPTDADNVLEVAGANAKAARKLRELRGHKDLFTVTNTTPTTAK
jgi:hypothetical protein